MKTFFHSAFAVVILLLTMLGIPVLLVQCAPADLGMSLTLLMFFAVNPIVVMLLSVMAGTNVKRLWWIPFFAAFFFPIFFGIAVGDTSVLELYIYSAIYLAIGLLSMLFSHLKTKKA